MVKFLTQNHTYEYGFPTVTLAYFLRYPNPFSTHVISTDVIDRVFDPETQRLTTTRLHLKRSKMPSAILRLLPRNLLGASSNGQSQSYVLERSTVDVREGWMKTESRNLELTNLLTVVERQEYRATGNGEPAATASSSGSSLPLEALRFGTDDSTEVTTTVQLTSKFGQRLRERRKAVSEALDDDEQKVGLLARWSQSSLQRSIEAIGLKRAHRSQPNATEGMKVVLERLREGGLVGVLEGMRQDREKAMAMSSATTTH
ncbi:uncharacterized protein PV09_06472 [Verruconis gallopava]|uniref:PRELI/MSF1 domain-containing protein n=1 Tax=Verruconis gallopava TaxID=253628 RepID=A0A0D1YNP4_9PEZI|nr:uncharacterized protein PV09_06472 [Verruconis gallopava]KIW02327.1 hypothetical protein PV09_06472 [Verruconis gallopava]